HPLLASPASACDHPCLNVEHTLSYSVCRCGAVRMVLETSCTGFPTSHVHGNTCGYGDLV
ncbi:hypothetical protein M405DRAFT_833564, partial [Rhizopogon salebrosus TDB-379]